MHRLRGRLKRAAAIWRNRYSWRFKWAIERAEWRMFGRPLRQQTHRAILAGIGLLAASGVCLVLSCSQTSGPSTPTSSVPRVAVEHELMTGASRSIVTGVQAAAPPANVTSARVPQEQSAGSMRRVAPVSKNDVEKAWSGEKWPFSVDSGEVELVGCCSVLFRHGTSTYAVNGTARTAASRNGWIDIVDSGLWRDHPGGHGKVNIMPIIDLGLCLGESSPQQIEVDPEIESAQARAGSRTDSETGSSDATGEQEQSDTNALDGFIDLMQRITNAPEIIMSDLHSSYAVVHDDGGMWLEIEVVLNDHRAEGFGGAEVNGIVEEWPCLFILENDVETEELVNVDMLYVVFPDLSKMTFQIGGKMWLYSEDDYNIVLKPISD